MPRKKKYRVKIIVDVFSEYLRAEVMASSEEEAETLAREQLESKLQATLDTTIRHHGWQLEVESVTKPNKNSAAWERELWDDCDPEHD